MRKIMETAVDESGAERRGYFGPIRSGWAGLVILQSSKRQSWGPRVQGNILNKVVF